MRVLFLFLLCSIAAATNAQHKAWFVGVGGTYSIPGKQLNNQYFDDSQLGNGTLVNYLAQPVGRLGFYAEAGREWVWNLEKRINGMDAGIHFKTLNARQLMDGTLVQINEQQQQFTSPFTRQEDFKAMYPGAFLNFFNHYEVSHRVAFRNCVGINADLGFARGGSFEAPEFLTAQLHYRFGVVIKTNTRISIMPSLETPVLTAYPWQNFKSTYRFLDFRYRPLLFSVRIMLRDRQESKMDKGCLEIPEKRETPQLWDPSMRNYKKKGSKGRSKAKG